LTRSPPRRQDLEELRANEADAKEVAEADREVWENLVPDPVQKRTYPELQGLPIRTPHGTPVWAPVAEPPKSEVQTTPELYMSDKELQLKRQMEKLRERYTSLGADIPAWMN